MKILHSLFSFLFVLLFCGMTIAKAANLYGGAGDITSKNDNRTNDLLWIDEQNGLNLPLDHQFTDESGESISLGDIIDRPTIILPAYYYCPNSCSTNLVNLTSAIGASNWQPGKDFKIITFSFNEEETAQNARTAKQNYLALLTRDISPQSWKFLTGSKQSISAVTDAIGYGLKKEKDGTFIHPSALVVTDRKGMIVKYVYGTFIPGDIDMAIAEAMRGQPAMSVKRLLGYCFNYDPKKNRAIFQNIKIIAVIGFAFLGGLFFFYLRKSGKKDTSVGPRKG